MQLSTKLPFELMQTKWAATLNPVLAVPLLSGIQIDSIQLIANKPQAVNHLLQRMPQGWFVTDINANTAIWKPVMWNQNTITFESSSNVTISVWVY